MTKLYALHSFLTQVQSRLGFHRICSNFFDWKIPFCQKKNKTNLPYRHRLRRQLTTGWPDTLSGLQKKHFQIRNGHASINNRQQSLRQSALIAHNCGKQKPPESAVVVIKVSGTKFNGRGGGFLIEQTHLPVSQGRGNAGRLEES
ncbi:uncharacterized protein LOC129757444 [Uranotaenia lowii]|uniref:uncharacterized protein LOC129757444 n=1 Tax=Uranotaenia lowii TaxID=190385 RepID=UPI00247AE078|nr:uncharacterized protein LOC129757444 [Uranotaenia lowii]